MPCRQGARDDVVHPLALTGIETAILGQLERQYVARMCREDRLPARRGADEIPGDPGPERRDMRRLAGHDAGRLRRRLGRLQRPMGARHHCSLAKQHHETAAQAVCHRTIGIGSENRFQPIAGTCWKPR